MNMKQKIVALELRIDELTEDLKTKEEENTRMHDELCDAYDDIRLQKEMIGVLRTSLYVISDLVERSN